LVDFSCIRSVLFKISFLFLILLNKVKKLHHSNGNKEKLEITSHLLV
jgi:hypothetical protein